MATKIVCPYDKSHVIDSLRMPYHLIKCRKNHMSLMEVAVCPFNATHEVPRVELKYHMQNCPDKALLEKEITHRSLWDDGDILTAPVKKGCTDLPQQCSLERDDEIVTDQWDTDQEPSFMLPTSHQHIPRLRREPISERLCEERERALRHPRTMSKAARYGGGGFSANMEGFGEGTASSGVRGRGRTLDISSSQPTRPGLHNSALYSSRGRRQTPFVGSILARGRSLRLAD